MQATYDYETGKITRYFKFVEIGQPCKLTPTSTFVGDETCKSCKFNLGTFELSSKYRNFFSNNTCEMCSHPYAKDFEGCGCFVSDFNEKLQQEAFSSFYD